MKQRIQPFFLSLKWKSVLIISIPLVLLHFFFSYFFFQKLAKDFEEKVIFEQNKQIKILTELIDQTKGITGQFADSLSLVRPVFDDLSPIIPTSDKAFLRMEEAVNQFWLEWKLIWGFESLSLYHDPSKEVKSWGGGQPSRQFLDKLFYQVLKTESIQRLIYCQQQCVLHVAVPVLLENKFKAIISIGKPMAETLISFEKITRADIAIVLAPIAQVQSLNVTGNFISAVTNSQYNRPLLEQYLSSRNKNSHQINEQFNYDKIHYRISSVAINSMNKAPQDNSSSFIIINDIENNYQILKNYQNSILVITLVSLLVTFFMLYYLLNRSVRKITRISHALPFLSSNKKFNNLNKYQKIIQILSQGSKLYPIFDEVDQLQSTSIDLANKLEQFENEQKLSEKQMLWTATHDSLTNLYNRRYFQDELERLLKKAQYHKQKLSLFYLDLDNFKVVNDTCGHSVGDRLLISVAENLSKLVKANDLICHIGGDEFVIISSSSSLLDLTTFATKINHCLNTIYIKDSNDSFSVGASIGIAIYPEHGMITHDLLANADLAMCRAKEVSYNLFHIYDPEINYHEELKKKLDWQLFIEQAIENKWLKLYYQPILNIKTDRISHYECLLRIIDDEGNMSLPSDFIKYSESLGLIETIDIMIVNMAIKKHRELQKSSKKYLKLSINLSGKSINSEMVKNEIRRLLLLPDVKADNIIFEITETAAVADFISAKSFINEIKKLGCHFALDDFGTGFSSFYYLKNLSFDYIKIDGAFIKDLEKENADRVFVKALSEVAGALGQKIIAEFVNTEGIITILKDLNIDYAQGFYISKPLAQIKI